MSSRSPAAPNAFSLMGVGSAARSISLTLAVLTTGLISGFFYAYACSVTLGLALLPDEQYIEAMQAINATVRNGLFAFSFFGAVLTLLLALTLHSRQPRSRRFVILALATVLYIGGGFMVTFLANVPMNEELARVGEAAPTTLAQVRAEYERPWNFWNGVRTFFSSLAFLALIGACLSRSD
ncbi:MAG: anthrone oxygenase family protein [Rubrobacteraceae bacterium]